MRLVPVASVVLALASACGPSACGQGAPATRLPAPPPAATGETLVLAHGTVLDMTGGPPRVDTDVVVQDGRIVTVGAGAAEAARAQGARVVDVSGAWIVPALVDAHVHL